MTIHPMASTTQAQTGTTDSAAASPAGVNQDQFLQLLVAQIRYQDPTNPTESTQFVTQLAQFSSLEQLIAIRGDLDSQNKPSATGTQKPDTAQGGK